MSLRSIVLAAGKGTRMKSKLPKVLHEILDKPMLDYVLDRCFDLSPEKPIVVVGHGGDMVANHLDGKAEIVVQREQLGTGHAVMMGIDLVDDNDDVLIVCGDTPLLTTDTLKRMRELKKESDAVVLSAKVSNSFGYGRVVRDGEKFIKIVEEKDATEEQKRIDEINAGTYMIRGELLKRELLNLKTENAQGEYYLTDVFEEVAKKGVVRICTADSKEILGINNRVQLSEATHLMKIRINRELMMQGVTIVDENNTYIDSDVVIGSDCIIYPNTRIKGDTTIGEGCIIRENTTIEDCTIGDYVEIKSSTLLKSDVGSYTTVGPYAYLRPKSRIGEHCKIGDFVEIKNANFGDYSKSSHLSYIGDADVGRHVNIGCGVVFVNYDGTNKHRSTVGDYSFIGSNSNLVAPVQVGELGFVAAGSTVTKDVPDGALVVARNKEHIKEGWSEKKGLIKKK